MLSKFDREQLYLINILYNIGSEECEIKYRIALQTSKNDEAKIQASSFFEVSFNSLTIDSGADSKKFIAQILCRWHAEPYENPFLRHRQ